MQNGKRLLRSKLKIQSRLENRLHFLFFSNLCDCRPGVVEIIYGKNIRHQVYLKSLNIVP